MKTLMLPIVLGLSLISWTLDSQAAPNKDDVCIRTTAGDIVCGKPEPLIPNRQENLQTVQSDNNITWELHSCLRKNKIISCNLAISANDDRDTLINLNSETKIVDLNGNEYSVNKVQIGNKFKESGNFFNFTIAKGGRYQTILYFYNVPATLTQANLLQINALGGEKIRFRDVSIN